MARLKAAALDKSARYFPFGRRKRQEIFFCFFLRKRTKSSEFVRTPDFLWKIHATGRFESKPIFQIKWSLGFWRHVTFSGVKLFGGGGLWVALCVASQPPQFKSEPPFHTPKWSFLVGKPMGLLGTTILRNPQKVALLLHKQTVDIFFLSKNIQQQLLFIWNTTVPLTFIPRWLHIGCCRVAPSQDS